MGDKLAKKIIIWKMGNVILQRLHNKLHKRKVLIGGEVIVCVGFSNYVARDV